MNTTDYSKSVTTKDSSELIQIINNSNDYPRSEVFEAAEALEDRNENLKEIGFEKIEYFKLFRGLFLRISRKRNINANILRALYLLVVISLFSIPYIMDLRGSTSVVYYATGVEFLILYFVFLLFKETGLIAFVTSSSAFGLAGFVYGYQASVSNYFNDFETTARIISGIFYSLSFAMFGLVIGLITWLIIRLKSRNK